MPSCKEKKILPYSSREIFNLVMDIDNYPKFLPWCLAAKVTKHFNKKHLNADLVINFKGFSQKYTSDVRSGEISDKELIINAVSIDGPFKSLINSWKFKDISLEKDKKMVEVNFSIDFEFKSMILNKMIGLVFEKATKKMVDAFEKRAQELYGYR